MSSQRPQCRSKRRTIISLIWDNPTIKPFPITRFSGSTTPGHTVYLLYHLLSSVIVLNCGAKTCAVVQVLYNIAILAFLKTRHVLHYQSNTAFPYNILYIPLYPLSVFYQGYMSFRVCISSICRKNWTLYRLMVKPLSGYLFLNYSI